MHATAFIDERPAERRVMAPREVDILTALVRDALVNAQNRLVADKTDCLNEMKRSSDRAYFKTNFDFIRLILRDHVAPGKKQDFTVLSDFSSLMKR